ncbi:MAG: imidazolonepropionase [Candidatus Acetothermia bacterium]
MGRKILTEVGQMVTPTGDSAATGSEMDHLKVLEDAEIMISDGTIEDVGLSGDFTRNSEEGVEVLNLQGKTVLPGLIDPHTHFVFSGYRSEEFRSRLQGKSYEEIADEGGGIRSSVSSTRDASFEELKKVSRARLESMARYGITAVEGKTGYGLDVDTELKQLRVMIELDEETPLEVVPTFLGAHSIPEEHAGRREDYVDLVMEKSAPEAAERGAEFCDVFCDRGAFTVEESKRILNHGKELGLTPKIHADEIAGTGGAELAAEVSAISAEHLLKASWEGLMEMKREGVIAVLLPITAFSLREKYARARDMIDAGLSVALATDFNPGSCYSESVPLLISLATLYMGMTLEETITGLTLNAAAALDRADRLGTIEPGKQADLVILDAPDYGHLAYHIGVSSVERVIKKGETIWKKKLPRF